MKKYDGDFHKYSDAYLALYSSMVQFEEEVGKGTDTIDSHLSLAQQKRAIAQGMLNSLKNKMSNTLLITFGVAVLVALIVAFLVARAISKPIVGMTRAMSRLAEGDLDVEVPAQGRRDDIGNMAGGRRGVQAERHQDARARCDRRGPQRRSARAHRGGRRADPEPDGRGGPGGCRRLLEADFDHLEIRGPAGGGDRRQQAGRDGGPGHRRDRRSARRAGQDGSDAADDRRLSRRLRAAAGRHQRGGREPERHRGATASDVARGEIGDGRNSGRRQRSQRTHHQAGGGDRRDVGGDGRAGQHGGRQCDQSRERQCQSEGRIADGGRSRPRDGRLNRSHGAHLDVVGQDLQHHRADRRYRLPDEPPGAQRIGGSGARRRRRQGLCGGRGRSAAPGAVGGAARPTKSKR